MEIALSIFKEVQPIINKALLVGFVLVNLMDRIIRSKMKIKTNDAMLKQFRLITVTEDFLSI